MSSKGINLHEVKDFVIPGDKNKPTIWKIGVLDSRIRAKLDDDTTVFSISPGNVNETNTHLKASHKNLETVRFGLKGFDNFLDEKGKPIKYSTEIINIFGKSYTIVAQSILDIIPMTVVSRLAQEIIKENILSEKEIKNSG